MGKLLLGQCLIRPLACEADDFLGGVSLEAILTENFLLPQSFSISWSELSRTHLESRKVDFFFRIFNPVALKERFA